MDQRIPSLYSDFAFIFIYRASIGSVSQSVIQQAEHTTIHRAMQFILHEGHSASVYYTKWNLFHRVTKELRPGTVIVTNLPYSDVLTDCPNNCIIWADHYDSNGECVQSF